MEIAKALARLAKRIERPMKSNKGATRTFVGLKAKLAHG